MIHWGILSTGRIASVFAKGLLVSKTGTLAAVASRTQGEADRFGIDKHGDFLKDVKIKRYGSYEALLAAKDIHAVYIATPHPQHVQWAVLAAEAGKHVLVEKPIGLNHAEAMVAIEAARKNGVFLMEAFMYRCHPMVAKIVELIKSKAIGQVRAIQANFAFNSGANYDSRLLKNDLGGGGILDVGGYCTSMVRLAAGVALGLEGPAEPVDFKVTGHVGPTGVDEYAVAIMKFVGKDSSGGAHEITAHIATGVQCSMDNTCRIYGSDGHIFMNQWVPQPTGTTITLNTGKEPQVIACDTEGGATAYTLEADVLAAAVTKRQQSAAFPAMSWADTLGNMKVLDKWRAGIGQVYNAEKPENITQTLAGRALKVNPDAFMKYGEIGGVNKPIARLVMGVDNQHLTAFPHAAAMFDDYFARGGNTFDTAFGYGGGQCEKALGQWVKNRGVRENVVILGKGAHTPNCDPVNLTKQLHESLGRLQMEYIDIYMMHRDNLTIPVGEFVDVLNEHTKAGRMRVFGGSNWTTARVDAFNEYARKNGKQGFSAVSNNLSLARMVEAVWSDCLTASDPAMLVWHEKTQMPLMPWSSQARGFFVVGDPANTTDGELVRCWYSPDNFARLARAKELAKQKNCTPIQIALAFVLNQKFPTFPLIGPRSIEETRISFEALRILLTADEVKWLRDG